MNGHFDLNPIVPGAFLLAELHEYCEKVSGQKLIEIPKVKFSKPLRPNQKATLILTAFDNSVKFSIKSNDELIASGKAILRPN